MLYTIFISGTTICKSKGRIHLSPVLKRTGRWCSGSRSTQEEKYQIGFRGGGETKTSGSAALYCSGIGVLAHGMKSSWFVFFLPVHSLTDTQRKDFWRNGDNGIRSTS